MTAAVMGWHAFDRYAKINAHGSVHLTDRQRKETVK